MSLRSALFLYTALLSLLSQLLPVFTRHIDGQLKRAIGACVQRLVDDGHASAAVILHGLLDAAVEAAHQTAAARKQHVLTQPFLEFGVERADQLHDAFDARLHED